MAVDENVHGEKRILQFGGHVLGMHSRAAAAWATVCEACAKIAAYGREGIPTPAARVSQCT